MTVQNVARATPRLRRVALLLVSAYLVTLLVNRSFVEVRGPSMEPLLWPGDRLLTIPAHRWWLQPGQVVVVAPPEGPARVVKRLRRLERSAGATQAAARSPRWLADVRGDAPDRSTDSRWWGPVPVRRIRRVAIARWPDLRTPLWRRVSLDGQGTPSDRRA
jgi:signal peptidase I